MKRFGFFGFWLMLSLLFPIVASAADVPASFGQTVVAQLPATIMALAVFIPALAAAYSSIRNKVATVQATATATLVANGGTLAKGTATPGAIPGLAQTGAISFGALQPTTSAAVTQSASAFVQ
jgi:hypothetical protein